MGLAPIYRGLKIRQNAGKKGEVMNSWYALFSVFGT